MIRYNFYITQEQKEKLGQLAGNTALSELVRRAIDEYLERHLPDYSVSGSKGGENGNAGYPPANDARGN